jgi:large repetitive protein
VTAGAFQASFGGGPTDAWVAKLNRTGTRLVYATSLGGAGEEDVLDLTTDRSGNAYIPGLTSSADFPVTGHAFQRTFGGGPLDGYVTKLNPSGTRAVWSTYLGGSDLDLAGSVRVDGHGVAHVPGFTDSADFPVTPGAYQTTNAGGFDVFLAKVALGKRHKGSGQRTASVTAAGGSGARAGRTRDRMAGGR